MRMRTYSVDARPGRSVTVTDFEDSIRVDVDGTVAVVTRIGKQSGRGDAPIGSSDTTAPTITFDGAEVSLRRRGKRNPFRRARGYAVRVEEVEYTFVPRTMIESVLYKGETALTRLRRPPGDGRVRFRDPHADTTSDLECALAVALAAAVGCGGPGFLAQLGRAAVELSIIWWT
ncbi:MAG: hypothetical protein QM809_01265 [Gordonia sp. (in: high G+C Gram-positive bacteria)]|uniref:hypothetical protein n=1 Tax=Gordonia sp. (in: high G+C Gram-positive bacteria) TaxID=84139 RepID=UPI0039E55F5A